VRVELDPSGADVVVPQRQLRDLERQCQAFVSEVQRVLRAGDVPFAVEPC
jgi:hypothetical protein